MEDSSLAGRNHPQHVVQHHVTTATRSNGQHEYILERRGSLGLAVTSYLRIDQRLLVVLHGHEHGAPVAPERGVGTVQLYRFRVRC